MSRWLIITVILCWQSLLFAQAAIVEDPRTEMQDHYREQRHNNQTLFYAAPYFHLVPHHNMVNITGSYEKTDLRVGSSQTLIDQIDTAPSATYWDLQGYDASPLVAFSAKKFGVGFGAEVGKKTLTYLSRNYGGSYQKQASDVSYSGLGTYIYYIPDLNLLPNYVEATLIGGYKSLNVVHQYDALSYFSADGTTADNGPEKLRYTVKKVDLGVNVSITLAKHFIVFPWLNIERRSLGTPKDGANTQDISTDENFGYDRAFIWNTTPNTIWGLDFAVDIDRVNFHLGGIFGLLANINGGSDRIKDQSISISATYDIKSQ